ncbi:polysaccharide export outer membrane protein [Desulfonatronum thiosulfatophilum]|uniref:Polysaccharide export outer membrane protein n=1 Tax=Desulfonatronum thiosulfatophilum TaxID=617002 RepID=A0A1G6EKK5_9BACT|nr:XrtA/PEP-CTERM system exopolysaccharide export protein [Desulfonatronum thiosulfatophilum]SDB57920.1 polysaccharide export outer membrane protein [Desulfonatronum thiosulfatophilum]
MKQRILLVLICLLFPLSATAQDYIIGEGDGLAISVWDEPKLSATSTVRPDGKITIPGLGDVRASGLTPGQLQESLEEKMKRLVHNPIVTVSVIEITNSRVFFFGGGLELGTQDLMRQTSLLQMLSTVENLQTADLRAAYVLRDGQKIKQDFHALIIEGDVREDILLKNNDVIFVPPLREPNVYVLGAVGAPTFIQYREGLTVLEAILQAGGFSPYARENSTMIVRKQSDEEINIPVRAKDLLRGDMTQNIELLPGDYIVVREGFF